MSGQAVFLYHNMATFQLYWWMKTSDAPTFIISGTNRHPSRTTDVLYTKLAGYIGLSGLDTNNDPFTNNDPLAWGYLFSTRTT